MDRPFKVVVTDCNFPNFDQERRVLEPIGAEIIIGQCRTEDEVIALARDADSILNQYAPMTVRVMNALPRCKVIVRYGIGLNNLDVPAATKAGILICNVPFYGLDEVSDHTVALILSCIRKIPFMSEKAKKGEWDFKLGIPIFRIHGSTLGLVGFGNIPRRVVQKMQPWKLRILAHDPFVSDEIFKSHGVIKSSFEEILGKSDIVSVHVPLTPATQDLFSMEAFKKMRRKAFLISTSRGGIVNEPDLCRALKERVLAGAALDVMSTEPPDPNDPLLQLPNIIITPHMAFYSEQSIVDLQRMAAEEVARVLKGEKPLSPVNSV